MECVYEYSAVKHTMRIYNWRLKRRSHRIDFFILLHAAQWPLSEYEALSHSQEPKLSAFRANKKLVNL